MGQPFLTGKALSAFLQILRAAGVTEFPTADGPIRLAPIVKATKPAVLELPPADEAAPDEAVDDDEEPADFRFALERLQDANFPGPRSRAEQAARERRAKAGV
jgi:hypothetical protein